MTTVFNGQLVQQNSAVEGAPLQQETILFHPQSNRFCILNRTSTFIWNRIRTPASLEQIAEDLCLNFAGVTPAAALRDVQTALSSFVELDLVITHIAEECR
jgi:hypothetical protein